MLTPPLFAYRTSETVIGPPRSAAIRRTWQLHGVASAATCLSSDEAAAPHRRRRLVAGWRVRLLVEDWRIEDNTAAFCDHTSLTATGQAGSQGCIARLTTISIVAPVDIQPDRWATDPRRME
jgi:hypothetical protein